MTIGERIKNRREELGLSQLELSIKMGYTNKSTISAIERRGNDMTVKLVKKYAEALNCSTAYLMGWEENEIDFEDSQPMLLANIATNKYAMELCNMFFELNSMNQMLLFEHCEFLLERQNKGK